MCGIAGSWKFGEGNRKALEAEAARMSDSMAHRGPDDSGVWADEKSGLALGHRRLSILDLSPRGHQPMESFCGRYIIVHNGEVYNFREIRKELEKEGVSFRSECDTEVILAAVSVWGIHKALKEFNGMFAFALWDKQKRTLFLARDRVGEKPLYYGFHDGKFYFSSELKAMRTDPAFKPKIDNGALALFFRYGYIPAPHSIYAGINKLKQGYFAEIDAGSKVSETCYWDALGITEKSLAYTSALSEEDTISELENLLKDSVKRRMISDVPLGAFLSGGIDSSAILALMQSQSGIPVRSFTIGFHEGEYNEAAHARKVAEHLGTDHTELYVTDRDARGMIPRLPDIYDEPFADSSQIPTFIISRLTRNYVTVSLSGDGGDELFGGYNRYIWATSVWKNTRFVPIFARKCFANAIKSVSPDGWDRIFEKLGFMLPGFMRQRTPGYKLHKMADVFLSSAPDEIYKRLVSQWNDPTKIVSNSVEPFTILGDDAIRRCIPDFTDRMMFLDLMTYLPGDILTKVDRASMAVGLETRIPFLDHRVVEFSKRLPLSFKIRDGKGKRVIRKILNKYVPEHLIERPKMGFGVPIGDWLRGPLREWAEDLLDGKKLGEDGLLDPGGIRKVWLEHLSGKANREHLLWNVLMFRIWKERWL